jgi:2-amino-4-hydroxy-6-hydroxymethyldihydropteridine diphosphokinase
MIILGLGSNQGDREVYLQKAINALKAIFTDFRVSRMRESAALLPEGAAPEWNTPFLNMAVGGETDLSPQDLLKTIKEIEKDLGRVNRGRWGPREIDIDILIYHDQIMNTENLTIPHPELLKREFALLPLLELVPDWAYPITYDSTPRHH